jgi:hypothetical protein
MMTSPEHWRILTALLTWPKKRAAASPEVVTMRLGLIDFDRDWIFGVRTYTCNITRSSPHGTCATAFDNMD